MIRPGSTIGVLGGGQLGRMFVQAASPAGYRIIIRTDDAAGGPAAQVADAEFVGAYDDTELNLAFAKECDVVTSEFENLPVELLRHLTDVLPVRPGAGALFICQHRRREKEFLAANGFPHAQFEVVRSASEVCSALRVVGGRGILKTAAFGYDGRGQIRLQAPADNEWCQRLCVDAWEELGVEEAVLEGFVPFDREISVVGARGFKGEWVAFPPGENVHTGGILDYTIAPARVSVRVATRAVDLAHHIAIALDYVGTIGIEFFVLPDDSLVVNEIAPRPHNSGHHTIDACTVSQFGLQLQAVTGRALGHPIQHSPAVMVNLLGEHWSAGEPLWSVVNHDPSLRVHLYGKQGARPGRKMGHLTVLARPHESVEKQLVRALALRSQLDSRQFQTDIEG